ncbi:hypothetical protein QJS66_12270 [Kocuria rhizophila]|nr:hypothetical protein QJS66_12270 [Kocuria rhizophila]
MLALTPRGDRPRQGGPGGLRLRDAAPEAEHRVALGPKLRQIPQVRRVAALVGGAFDVMLLVRARGAGELRGRDLRAHPAHARGGGRPAFLIFEDLDVGG